jgi:NAD(P)-dependent dehydrogenase (short-subunit alcohol dehydrogenase family)
LSIEEGKKAFASFHLFPRLIDSEDLAYAVLYLISDESKNVNGSSLIVDAGWTAK